jgi:hypothetical protein
MMAMELVACRVPEDPVFPHTRGRIRGDLCSFFPAGIWCAITLVPPFFAVALQPGVAQSDPLRGPAHRDLHDFV